MTDKEREIFEKGFEEGYAVAKRNYEAFSAQVFTIHGRLVHKKLTPDRISKK